MSASDPLPLIVAGAGPALDVCEAAFREAQPGRSITRLELSAPDQFNYDIAPLLAHAPAGHRVFLALGNHAINFSRLKVMGDIRLAGYRMDNFISPRAGVAGALALGENSFVADGAVIGAGCAIRHNCYVGPRVVLGNGVQLEHSVWIAAGAIIGDGVVIGDNTTVGQAAVIAASAKIGRQCELLVPREYRGEIADKTFYSAEFPNPVRIYRPAPGSATAR